MMLLSSLLAFCAMLGSAHAANGYQFPTTITSDGLYTLSVAIGKSGYNNFALLLDTFEQSMWLEAASCKSKACLDDRIGSYRKNLYDPRYSSTYTATSRYAARWDVSGQEMLETFSIYNMLVVPLNTTSQTADILLATGVDDYHAGKQYDGVLGMGGLASTDPTSALYNLLSNSDPVITLLSLSNRGRIMLGDEIDPQLCNDLTYFPTADWSMTVSDLSVGNWKYAGAHFVGVPVYGSNQIGFPTAVLGQVISALGASYNFTSNKYEVDCERLVSLPDINIVIGGVTLPVTPKEYVVTPSTQCELAIGAQSPRTSARKDVIELGIPFFRNRCAVLDAGKKQIGFNVKLG